MYSQHSPQDQRPTIKLKLHGPIGYTWAGAACCGKCQNHQKLSELMGYISTSVSSLCFSWSKGCKAELFLEHGLPTCVAVNRSPIAPCGRVGFNIYLSCLLMAR